MFCPSCGAEIPDDSAHCSSCGTKISGEAPGPAPGPTPGTGSVWVSMISALIKADPSGALTLLGSFFIILGAFLPWVNVSFGGYWDGGATVSQLGVASAQGAVLLLIGVLFLVVVVLARSGAAGAWNVVMFLLSALALALIFQSIYTIGDAVGATIGAGVWLAMVGVLAVTAATLLERFGTAKK